MMTTITFDEPVNFSRNRFRNLDDFQTYLVQKLQSTDLSSAHKSVLDERLAEAKSNPDNFVTLDELKTSLKRK